MKIKALLHVPYMSWRLISHRFDMTIENIYILKCPSFIFSTFYEDKLFLMISFISPILFGRQLAFLMKIDSLVRISCMKFLHCVIPKAKFLMSCL